MSVSGYSKIVMDNWQFYDNIANDEWSVLYFIGAIKSHIQFTKFRNNTVLKDGNTIELNFSDAVFINSTIEYNTANINSMGVLASSSVMYVYNCTFKSDISRVGSNKPKNLPFFTGGHGGFFFISSGSELIIQTSTFENWYAKSGGCIYMIGTSRSDAYAVTFSGAEASNNGGVIFADTNREVIINNWHFSKSAAPIGSYIFIQDGNVQISNSNFLLSSTITPIRMEKGHLSLQNTNFIKDTSTDYDAEPGDITGIEGGIIYGSNLQYLNIANTKFEGMTTANKGGVLYLTSIISSSKTTARDGDNEMLIQNWSFTSNSAKYGGAIYIENISYLDIESCTFYSNSAIEEDSQGGHGGAIYYSSSGLYLFDICISFCII